jgi:hypothetical protein
MKRGQSIGSSRTAPIVVRPKQVIAANGARNRNFRQISLSIAGESTESIPAPWQAACSASSRQERWPSISPNRSRAIVPVWRTTPGRSMAAPM